MVSINYWLHRENNTILIINDWIHWTVLDDMKVLLELGMSLKKRQVKTNNATSRSQINVHSVHQSRHSQSAMCNKLKFFSFKIKIKSPNFANDLHILNVNVTTGLEQECFTYTSFQFL
jgi:hypothetical protein